MRYLMMAIFLTLICFVYDVVNKDITFTLALLILIYFWDKSNERL